MSTRQRKNRQTQINRLKDIYDMSIQVEKDYTLFDIFSEAMDQIRDVHSAFFDHHNSIISSLPDDDESFNTEDEIRRSFESQFYKTKGIFSQLKKKIIEVQEATTPNVDKIPLPKIKLTHFDGDILKFQSFIDMFNSVIHNNSQLSSIEKFNYLLSSLEGQALTLVQTLPMTSSNYSIAYDTLIKRYKNVRVLATSYWKAIEQAPKLNAESGNDLRNLLDIFSDNVTALKNLKMPTEHWDFILVQMLLSKLDITTITQFEIHHNSSEIPKYPDLVNFLSNRCTALNNLCFSSSQSKSVKSSNKIISKPFHTQRSITSLFVQPKNKTSCSICRSDHSIYRCQEFLAKSPADRFKMVKDKNLCCNCLSHVHTFKSCKSQDCCHHCGKKHHTLLHFQTSNRPEPTDENSHGPSNYLQSSTLNVSSVNFAVSSDGSAVLLGTACVEVLDSFGNFQQLRCLLDSGSMTSFITKRCLQRLCLKAQPFSVALHGLGSMNAVTNTGSIVLSVRSRYDHNSLFSVEAVVLSKICDNLPYSEICTDNWHHITHLKLADPHLASPGAIDLLLGADIFPQIFLNGSISGQSNQPTAINTIFGFVVMGKFSPLSTNKGSPTTSLSCTLENLSSLEKDVQKFWQLESVPEANLASQEDILCEQIFTTTTTRTESGRFVVELPFREGLPLFPGSRDLAIKRFLSLEKRLLRESNVYEQYKAFMKEYLTCKHMESVDALEPSSYYIPHHHILRPASLSTTLRVVFNCSAKVPGQSSLNDHLIVGPKLQQNIGVLLLQFRLHRYVLTADIKMMYRQILIAPHHRDYHRIIWRFSPDDPLQDFRLNTVTYGSSPAPFLALRTLRCLAEENVEEFPLASSALLNQTYVDDVVSSCPTRDSALALKEQLISLLALGGFELRKWSSNDPSLLNDLPPSHICTAAMSFDMEESSSLKVLGLHWSPTHDSFQFKISYSSSTCTKRNVLSRLARIYDPMGLLSPLTFLLKYQIQLMWLLKLDWDTQPPITVVRTWDQIQSEIQCLSQFSLPRHLLPDNYISCELHCFGDASEKGYCAALYFCFELSSNVYVSRFVCAKSRVAPLKKLSLPRLELCAAVLVARLVSFVLTTFESHLTFQRICCWSDSQVSLDWIRSPPQRWKTFVANRVSFIHDQVSPESWYYVPSAQNPADLGSRGLLPRELLHSSLWWAGPSFLISSDRNWPAHSSQSTRASSNFSLEEERKVSVNLIVQDATTDILELVNQSSSLYKTQKIVAYLLRFVNNAKYPNKPKYDGFSSYDLYKALLVIAKHVQAIHFKEIILLLERGKRLPKSFQKLSPFFDKDHVIRVGGRLTHAPISFERKFPVLLPSSSHFTDLLINHFHVKYLHAGILTVQSLISQQFYIISAKRSIRRIISQCIRCWKTHPTSVQPLMGDLPMSRVSQAKCFLHTGVDFAGPFKITLSKYRGVKTTKAYLCLFVCFTTKAIHLELCSDLSADTFLAALKRFLSRRGRCTHMYSDNGTNFVSAHRQLNTLFASVALQEHISWHFSPPSGAHLGGLWERSIKSVKSHLSRVVGEQILTYEELSTVLTQIEAIVNSRPISPLSTDPHDLSALTPSHFLTMEPLGTVPEADVLSIPVNRLSRWQLVCRIHQHFWARWSREYLHTLHQRSKWTSDSPNIEKDTLVLIRVDNAPPLTWPMGRVLETFPGPDGKIRVVSVRTASGILRRPVVKLCPLPCSQ